MSPLFHKSAMLAASLITLFLINIFFVAAMPLRSVDLYAILHAVRYEIGFHKHTQRLNRKFSFQSNVRTMVTYGASNECQL